MLTPDMREDMEQLGMARLVLTGQFSESAAREVSESKAAAKAAIADSIISGVKKVRNVDSIVRWFFSLDRR